MPFLKDYEKLAQHKITIIKIIDKNIKYIINNIDYPKSKRKRCREYKFLCC